MLKRLLPFLLPACLFLLVFGLKLDVLHRYGSDLPRWDQLDAEGLAVFVPLAGHRLGAVDLFRAHNEHRIVWTKLLGLVELKLNGQWDARLQCTVNAALHSAIAVLVFLFARRGLDRRLHPPAFVLLGLLFGLPLAWENPLAGFHSQQYFLLGFSFGAICLLPTATAWSARWWTGAGCLFAALFTMGSGLFAAAIVLGVLGLRGWVAADLAGAFRRALPTVGVCAAALTVGALGRVSVSYHEALKAGSVTDFLRYALHCLQWPAQQWSWLALILWWPVALLAGWVLRRREPAAGSFPLVLLGLAAWVLLQILATAYTRGAGAGMPSSRYADTLAFGLIVNGLALAWLWPRFHPGRWRTAAALAWILAVAAPVYGQTALIFREVYPDNRRHLEASEENVRRYLATEDASHLDSPDIPYPGIRALRERIDLPAIRAILPASVRVPLSLAAPGHPGPFASHSTIRRARSQAAPAATLPAPLSALSPLAQRTIWFSAHEGAFSHPLEFARPMALRFIVAGQGAPELFLASPSREVRLDLGKLSPAAWQRVHVLVPPGRFLLQARVPANSWLAFAEPVEMARGSYWCWRLVRLGAPLWQGTAVIGGLAWAALLWRGRAEMTLLSGFARSETAPRP